MRNSPINRQLNAKTFLRPNLSEKYPPIGWLTTPNIKMRDVEIPAEARSIFNSLTRNVGVKLTIPE